MSVTVLWIDREHAKIFQFSEEKMERREIKSSHVDHHTHEKDQKIEQKYEHVFFNEILKSIRDVAQILIVGPGVARHQFKNFLVEHHPLIAKKVVACESVDHPTDAQIAALARKFFNLAVAK